MTGAQALDRYFFIAVASTMLSLRDFVIGDWMLAAVFALLTIVSSLLFIIEFFTLPKGWYRGK